MDDDGSGPALLSKRHNTKASIILADDLKAAIVQGFDEELATSGKEKLPGENRSWELTLLLPFFAQMRRLTLVGYYTSPIGQEQELKVDIIPGELHSCVPANPEVKQ